MEIGINFYLQGNNIFIAAHNPPCKTVKITNATGNKT